MMSKKLVQQELSVEEGGHLDIVVTEVVDINRFWINVRTTEIFGARKKVMDLFYKMEGKDMYVENGSVVAAPYYQSNGDQRGQGHHWGKLLLLPDSWGCEEGPVGSLARNVQSFAQSDH
jgi:hypothetical protein